MNPKTVTLSVMKWSEESPNPMLRAVCGKEILRPVFDGTKDDGSRVNSGAALLTLSV